MVVQRVEHSFHRAQSFQYVERIGCSKICKWRIFSFPRERLHLYRGNCYSPRLQQINALGIFYQNTPQQLGRKLAPFVIVSNKTQKILKKSHTTHTQAKEGYNKISGIGKRVDLVGLGSEGTGGGVEGKLA